MVLPLARASMASSRRQRWLLLLAALGVGSYGAYRAYHNPAVAEKRRRLATLLRALTSVADAVSASAETVCIVSEDLNRFLRGDSEEIPLSLRQLSKLAASEDVRGAVARLSEAFILGILRGTSAAGGKPQDGAGPTAADLALDRIFSPAGSGFASVVVGSFARNLVLGFYAAQGGGAISDGSDGSGNSPIPSWVPLLCSDKIRVLIGDCIRAFVGTAVTVYLEKTIDLNMFDEMFSGLTNPKHEAKMKDVLVSVCNGAVETLVKSSHKVMTCQPSSSPPSTDREEEEEEGEEEHQSAKRAAKSPLDTLAAPTNRSFVLDLTGRVTSESVRSVLDYAARHLFHGAKEGLQAARGEIAERGLEVVRYAGGKSLIILTVCLSLCLHLMSSGPRYVLPADLISSTKE